MQFGKLLHPIAMNEQQSFIFRNFSCKPFILAVTAIISALLLSLPQASAQRVKLDVPLVAGEKETDLPACSQEHTKSQRFIKGVVTDTTGDPLPGVTVMVQLGNEKTGTISDGDGKFNFEIPSSYTKDSLVLRMLYVGFITQESQLSLLQENDHLEICLAIDHRQIGCPVINPSKKQKVTDLVKKPDLISVK